MKSPCPRPLDDGGKRDCKLRIVDFGFGLSIHNPNQQSAVCVTPPRLERGTYSLEGCCSIQLSYGAGFLHRSGLSKGHARRVHCSNVGTMYGFSPSFAMNCMATRTMILAAGVKKDLIWGGDTFVGRDGGRVPHNRSSGYSKRESHPILTSPKAGRADAGLS